MVSAGETAEHGAGGGIAEVGSVGVTDGLSADDASVAADDGAAG